MRPFETLLLLAELLALVVLSAPRLRAAPWARHAPVLVLPMAAAQAMAEGPRWQMVPAYALVPLLLLVRLGLMRTSAGRTHAGRPLHRSRGAVAVGLGALLLALAVALPALAPVFRFPRPAGPYGIGTVTYHWADDGRSELLAADPKARRQLMVQVWYPAMADPSARRAAYLADTGAVTAAFARIHGQPAFLFGHLAYVTAHAVPSAAVAADRPRYPVLVFLEGATGFRQMNTFQVEQLVSHGYIVAAVDQPGAAATVVFPQGRQAAGLTLAQFQALVRPSYLPDSADAAPGRSLLPNGRALGDESIVPYLAQDVTFTLDRLAALNEADPQGILAGRLDLQRVGAFGVSLGGIVVGESCRVDRRLRACLVMDAPMPISVVRAGLRQPGMWITRDAASMRLERKRSGGWPDAEIDAHLDTMRAVYDGLAGPGYFVHVPGMFHANFTDIPVWTPLAPLLGLSGPIDARRAHDIVNAYTLAFFERHLQGRPAGLLDGPGSPYPEVLFESRRP